MSWEIGYDTAWERDIGYGVPSTCDNPDCIEEINRGLDYVCGGEPHGGDNGCGLFFCEKHSYEPYNLCEKCVHEEGPFKPKEDLKKWVRFKLRDPSWSEWREENPKEVKKIKARLK